MRTLFPISYYILCHNAPLLILKLPKTKSSFFAQYQVFNSQTRPLTKEVMIISEDGQAVSAVFIPDTLSNQECMTLLSGFLAGTKALNKCDEAVVGVT